MWIAKLPNIITAVKGGPKALLVLEALYCLAMMLALALYWFYTDGMDIYVPDVVYNQF